MEIDIPLTIEAVAVIILPIAAILLSRSLFRKRLKILGLVFVATLALAVWREIPQEILGFSTITSGQLLWYIFSAVIFSILLAMGNKFFISKNQVITNEIYVSSILLSFAQEFIFNAYFLSRFAEVYGIAIAIIIIGVLFAVMHQALERGIASFIVCFFSGVLLAGAFAVAPNLWLATAVHSLANIQALRYRLPGIGPSLGKLTGSPKKTAYYTTAV